MNAVLIRLDDRSTLVEHDGSHHLIPIGAVSLTTESITSDPPRPEELSNAIGTVFDHLDDMLRALPSTLDAEGFEICGDHAAVIAAVEVGGPPALPFELDRAAAEDVFRTVATESAADRARNPGLPPEAVESIVGACCIVVALMRHLHLDAVDLGARP
jgi:exopolyphosphatase / guanosine-5'-triphosphate,3'-diphosphate pyrophosphatase